MTLQNNERERAFGLIYRRPRYFLFSCDRSLQVLPNWRLRNQRQGEQGLSDIIVHGTSLFLRGMRSLADFGHSVSCIAFRCGRARKFAPPQRTRGWNGTSAPSRTRRASKRDRGTVDGFWFLRVPLIVRHQHTAFNPGDPEMSAEVGKVQRADGARNYKEINLVRPGQQDDYIADRVIFKANPEIGDSRAPILGMVIHQLLPACGMVLLFY